MISSWEESVMDLSFGAELRRRRLAAGYTLGRFAASLHYSKSHLSKVELGRKAPSEELVRRCDAALGAGGALVALVAGTPAMKPRAAVPATLGNHWVVRLDADGRGDFGPVLPRSTLVADALGVMTWAMSPATASRRSNADEFDAFRSMFDRNRALAQIMSPAALLPMLIGQTHALRVVAGNTTAPARRSMSVLAGRYADFTGWLAQEAGDDAGALWWTDRAVEFAATGGDDEMAAHALVRRADVALYRQDARSTVALAQCAEMSSRSRRVRGLAAQRQAQGHALAGDYDRCRRALDRAARWLDRRDDESDDDQQPVLGSSTIDDPVEMATGWCLFDLGRPKQASEKLRVQLDRLPSHARRTRARLGARYALSLGHRGVDAVHGLV